MPHIRILGRLVNEYASLAIKQPTTPSNERFIRAVYHVLFKRDPDPDGWQHYLKGLNEKRFGKRDMLRSMLNSDEFRNVYGAKTHPLEALHGSRLRLIQQHLPPAETILDLGGAAHDHPQGALLAMGYPHRPREISIIDLPPEQRIGGTERAEADQEIVTHEGTQVRYMYRSMSDLDWIPDASVDMVVSGESIEHISEREADIVCREAFRILKPGGHFCLDTPNAALTRLESPHAMIHPEHQKEYLVHEIREKLLAAGFKIVDAKGLCPMPQSLRTKQFSYREMGNGPRLSDKPEEGYLFFFHAIKPEITVQP